MKRVFTGESTTLQERIHIFFVLYYFFQLSLCLHDFHFLHSLRGSLPFLQFLINAKNASFSSLIDWFCFLGLWDMLILLHGLFFQLVIFCGFLKYLVMLHLCIWWSFRFASCFLNHWNDWLSFLYALMDCWSNWFCSVGMLNYWLLFIGDFKLVF